jgi:hypothetical protein
MTGKLRLKDLEKLSGIERRKVLESFIRPMAHVSSVELIGNLSIELAKLEDKYNMSSKKMMAKVDCFKRETNKDYKRWANLYTCYQQLRLPSS